MYLLWDKFVETCATFRPATTGLDHALVVACVLTQTPAEGPGVGEHCLATGHEQRQGAQEKI